MAVLDRQIAGHATEAEDLTRALDQLAPHIHAEDCPLCGRDFSEVSRICVSAWKIDPSEGVIGIQF